MKLGGTSVQDAQAIDRVAAVVRERSQERSARTSALANALTPNNDPAPEARKSLAPGPPTRAIFAWRGGGHPEASNAKPEGWVRHKIHLSPAVLRASVQDAQAIDCVAAMIRERGDENLATISASTNMLAPGNDPAPKARSRLAHPEASNAKPEGWVKHKMRLSPVGATQEGPAPRLTANEILSSKFCPTTRQVSGHEFTRAVPAKKDLGFSPCTKEPQGLKTNFLRLTTARLRSCPDTCRGQGNHIVLFNSASPIAFLRASAPPRCKRSSRRVPA
jgi:hypothetical protein